MTKTPFVWEGKLPFSYDRPFWDPSNDLNFNRNKKLENFVVLKVVISKEFQKKMMRDILINCIWFTPIVEQIHDAVDEGTG
jgi:alpha-amylase